jgi:hypothetical protein
VEVNGELHTPATLPPEEESPVHFEWEAVGVCQQDITISALFWDFTQRRMVVPYQHFRTTYQSHLQGTDRLSRNIGNYLPIYAA